MQPLLIGYSPKLVVQRPDWLDAPQVEEICSASECVSSRPAKWIDHWTHNINYWVYTTIGAAWDVVPLAERGRYQIHGYRMYPKRWDNGAELSFAMPAVEAEPLPSSFELLGFDAVSLGVGLAGFGHSPLSCNHMATEIPTNKHCLLDDAAMAFNAARDFSNGNVEPGPYHVVEVWRADRSRSCRV
jgi:hypothetical protein